MKLKFPAKSPMLSFHTGAIIWPAGANDGSDFLVPFPQGLNTKKINARKSYSFTRRISKAGVKGKLQFIWTPDS